MLSTTLKRIRPLLYAVPTQSNPYTQTACFSASCCVRQTQEISTRSHSFQHRIQNVTFSSAAIDDKECWRCKQSPGNGLFCASCNSVQRLSPHHTYFSILGLEEQFNIDVKMLSRKFRELQSVLHPDKFSGKSDEEKEISYEMSSLVNRAYSTLHSPLQRGLYMLQLDGCEIPEGNTSLDAALLIEVMEFNEELESLNDVREITDFQTCIQGIFSELTKQLEDNFQEKNIVGATKILSKMRYFETLLTKVKEKKMLLVVAGDKG